MTILYEDADVLVCVKEAGLLSQSADGRGGADLPTLLAAYLKEKGEDPRLHVVHRLDRMTAGVMVLARHARAAAALTAAMVEGRMEKEYLAIAEGVLTPAEGRMEDLLFFDRVRDKTYVVDRPRRGVKRADLAYRTLVTLAADGVAGEGQLSLLSVRLGTGRTHQIRAQLAARRHPLVGDRRYGARQGGPLGLFACRLSFPHPTSGARLSLAALPPPTLPFSLFSSFAEPVCRENDEKQPL